MGINSKSYYQLDSTKREKIVKGNRNARHRKMEEENISEYYVKFIRPKRRIRDVRSDQPV